MSMLLVLGAQCFAFLILILMVLFRFLTLMYSYCLVEIVVLLSCFFLNINPPEVIFLIICVLLPGQMSELRKRSSCLL